MADILVVDDDQSIATAFERVLQHEGHVCTVASSAEDALRLVGEVDPDLVVMDIRMPGVDGLQALDQLRSRYPDVLVVMMTAYGTSQTSIDAIRAGAFEYLTKPLDLDQLRSVIRQALAARERRRRTGSAAAPEGEGEPQQRISLVGNTSAMQEVYKLIGRLAAIDVPALVVGEHGTGKELVVATIHDNSARRDRAFVSIDCGTLPEDLVEAELFGEGDGTVHLASVHALPKTLQARLTRALNDGRRRGTTRPTLSARVIASTDQDLDEAVESGAFSRELYDTLAVIVLRLPPLRDRRDDIPVLVRYFIDRFNEELNRSIRGVEDEVLEHLSKYTWMGNVVELESVIKRACIVTRGDVITMDDIGGSLADNRIPGRRDVESSLCRAVRIALQERVIEKPSGTPSSAFHEIVELVEGTMVKEALTITNGNQVKASELLGVNRATLRKKAASD
jgi:two-component system nitrogen regulation response regulator GlnG